jgi:leucyl-tRNA synthetase
MTDPEVPQPASDAPTGYDPSTIERKWQAAWESQGTNTPDLEGGADPYYALMMFPYPSAEGLHVGNLFAFTGNDIYGRFQRLQGHTVFEPLGYDAFGIHSENFAIKVGIHPSELIPRNIDNFRRQLKRAGLMVDWSHELSTTDPSYYKWTQWVFLQLYQQGLAYKKAAAVNWCPFDKTVLANEQVIGGACERCGTMVEQRFLEQWFFRITDYAGRLLANLDTLDWSESTKSAQRNWIGKSDGAEVVFPVLDGMVYGSSTASDGVPGEVPAVPLSVPVFTTRPDTIYGATYLVLAPEHPLVAQIATDEQRSAVDAYVGRASKQDLVSRKTTTAKSGVFTGAFATNPATGRAVPIWIADYVLMEYGTGAIMAVPGHDERDHEFARAYDLDIVQVVASPGDSAIDVQAAAFTETDGCRVINSAHFTGMTVAEAKAAIVAELAARHAATPVVNYRLHDWCISRQRYWGPPIPIVYCDACGTVPVPESQLPVLLPQIDDFRPDDSGVSPLARHEEWYHTSCPQCAGPARRETDVSDTFLDSAWYFLRYPSSTRDDVPFDAALTRKWLPVNSYIGGNEHAVLHLLYSRFITMVLKDAGHIDFEEPFTRFRAHGMIVREGAKMSKSRGNVVNPDEYMNEWGADAFRTYLMFLGPYEEGGDFQDKGISGVRRFLDRLWKSVHEAMATPGPGDPDVLRKLHQTIRKVGEDIARLSYNTAIAAMMEYMNTMRTGERTPRLDEVRPLVQLASPFAPHLAEELWAVLGETTSVFDAGWPAFDASLIVEHTMTMAVQVNGKTRGTITLSRTATQDDALAAAMADPSIAKFVTGPAKRVIFVAGRMLNIVV